MIAGAALAAWLADRDGQQSSHAAVEACARRWSRQPLMTEVERQLADLPEKTSENVLAVARDFMDKTDEIAVLMDELIVSSGQDPFFRPPFHPMSSEIHTGLLLFHNVDLSIALGVSGVDQLAAKKAGKRGATSIGFTGVTSLFRYMKAGDATVSFWEAPPITDAFVASDAGQCRLVDRRRIADGDEILIDGRYQSFIVEHATSDMVYLQAIVRPEAAPLTAEYDSKSLSFIGASSTDEASSRVQMMVSLLRTMEREDALPLIEESLASPHFYTRWHIMRELLAMDAERALPSLRAMAANDPHPEVRATAKRTLDLFFADESDGAEGALSCPA
ncbi:MAG TPA: HEAT repeat domain-containing protein [Allosphingosinicella sp.]